MSRQTWMESEIPTGVESPVYLDARQIARGLGNHLGECFMGQVTGGGGIGGTILHVPFEPGAIVAVNQAGANPAVHVSLFTPTPAHATIILAVAANGTPPTKTKVADNDWTVTFPVGMLPNAEVMTALIYGVRDVAGGL
jgi:hypothetical protein